MFHKKLNCTNIITYNQSPPSLFKSTKLFTYIFHQLYLVLPFLILFRLIFHNIILSFLISFYNFNELINDFTQKISPFTRAASIVSTFFNSSEKYTKTFLKTFSGSV